MKSGENIGCGVLSTFPSSFCCESDIMQISLILAQQIAELFLILLIGCVLVKARLLKSADSRVLSVVMVYAVMPCVIINAFQVDYSPAVVTGLLYAFALAIALHALLLLLARLLHPLRLDVIERAHHLRGGHSGHSAGAGTAWRGLCDLFLCVPRRTAGSPVDAAVCSAVRGFAWKDHRQCQYHRHFDRRCTASCGCRCPVW